MVALFLCQPRWPALPGLQEGEGQSVTVLQPDDTYRGSSWTGHQPSSVSPVDTAVLLALIPGVALRPCSHAGPAARGHWAEEGRGRGLHSTRVKPGAGGEDPLSAGSRGPRVAATF